MIKLKDLLHEKKDHEGSMAKSQLERSKKYAMMIYKIIQNVDKDGDGEVEFPAWVQSKLTKSMDYLQSVYNYLDGKDGLGDKFQESMNENFYVLYQKKGVFGKPEAEVFKSKTLAQKYAKSLEKTHIVMFLNKQAIQNMKGIKVKNESINEQKTIDTGFAFKKKTNIGDTITLVTDKSFVADKWKEVTFVTKPKFAHQTPYYSGGGSGAERLYQKEKPYKMTAAEKNIINKILKNREDKHYLEKDNFTTYQVQAALKRNK